MDSNNNVDDELGEEDEEDDEREAADDDEEAEEDNGSDNNISVTSSPVAVRRRTGLSSSLDEEDNEAANIITTNTATAVASPTHPGSAAGCENGLLRRKSQSDHGSRLSPPTVGAFTSLIQRNSGHYLKTSDLLAGFSTAPNSSPHTVAQSSSFNPSLAAQLFLQTSQPLLPPPSQWLYTQLYGANYGDFSWFRNSLSGATSSAFRSISAAAAASLSPEPSLGAEGTGNRSGGGRVIGSDGDRSLDRSSPPVTSTSKRSPSPSGEEGNLTEEEQEPLAKKLDPLGAFTRAAVGAGEKQVTDVWRPY